MCMHPQRPQRYGCSLNPSAALLRSITSRTVLSLVYFFFPSHAMSS